MDIEKLLIQFEQKLILQRYSPNSIRNYKSAMKSFLEIAEKKFSHPSELNEAIIEKYVLWKVQKHKIGSSHQRKIIASIDKFYSLVYNTKLNIEHLYPARKSFSLPNYLTTDEVKKLIESVENIKHRCIIKLLYGSGLRLGELLVHQIRNSLKFVSSKDKQAVMRDIRAIYQADNQQQARKALLAFSEKWQGKYDKAIKSWEENWDNLTAFLEYPPAIRKLIYTTNIIESFNSVLRKYTRNKKVFPNDQSAIKSIYLAAQQIRVKWQRSRAGWNQVYNQLYIYFEDRIK